MQTTAQLQFILGYLTGVAELLISKADRIDVQCDFAGPVATKFRKPQVDLIARSRQLRQQAGEIYSRIDQVNAELEFRARPGAAAEPEFDREAELKFAAKCKWALAA